jgi:ligand-binding sensor protein
MRLADLLDLSVLQKLTDANYRASGMPIGIIDAVDGSVLLGFGWQDVCTLYHRVNPISAERCRESDDYIKDHLSDARPCEYTCKNGLRDIGVPIRVGGEHLATLFLGQFFYEGEAPDREFFREQARALGFPEPDYLAALGRVPVFSRRAVENILAYNMALAQFISELAEGSQRRARALRVAESIDLLTDV